MKNLIYVLAAIALAVPAFAQDHNFAITGYVTSVDPDGDGLFDGADDFDDIEARFDSSEGFGVALNFHLTDNLTLEAAAAAVEPEFVLTTGGAVPINGVTELEMIPVTFTLQWHFNPGGTFDPYVGAGAAYVLFDDVDDFDFDGDGDDDLGDLDSIDFDDDVGLVLNVGAAVNFSEMFGLYLDAKYVPVESSAEAVFLTGDGTSTDIEVNPLMFSAGLTLRF